MVTRDFDAMLAQRAGTRPTFRVGGQEFTVKAKLAFKKFAKLIATFEEADDEIAATEAFFRMVLVPSDRDRFIALLDADGEDDSDAVIDPEQIQAMTEWLMEYYTGKHRASSNGSSGGAGTMAQPLNVVSLNPRAG